MKKVRLFVALLVAALVPFAAGCGGSDSPGAGAATAVPADVAVFLSVDTDFDGDQWQAVEALAAEFPGGDDLLGTIAREIEADDSSDLSFEADVEPALGPETALVVLDLSGGDPVYVGLTQPDDPAALERIAAEGDEPLVVREVDGWHVIAEDEGAIDSFAAAQGGERLAGSEDFERAMDGLEEDALARVYVAGDALEDVEGFDAGALDALLPGGMPSVGAVLRAEDDGGRLDGRLVYDGGLAEAGLTTEPYEAELPDRVPGGVLAYVSFRDLEGLFSTYRDALAEASPEFESQLGQAEGVLGVSLEADIAPLFAGEGAVYVRPGVLIPEVTLVTQVEDEAQAVATLDRLVEGLGSFVPLGAPQRTEVAGVEVRELPVSPPVSLFYGAFDGLLVVTSSREGIADLRADGDRVADDEAYREALDRAGAPDETTGFAYVDLAEVAPLLLGFAELGAGAPSADAAEVRAYVEPLHSLVAWGTTEDDVQRFTLFLGIE